MCLITLDVTSGSFHTDAPHQQHRFLRIAHWLIRCPSLCAACVHVAEHMRVHISPSEIYTFVCSFLIPECVKGLPPPLEKPTFSLERVLLSHFLSLLPF